MNKELRIVRDGRIIARFRHDYAFVDFWDFVDNDACVVIRGVNAHGPSWIQKYSIANGNLVEECSGVGDIPAWARQYSDETQPDD